MLSMKNFYTVRGNNAWHATSTLVAVCKEFIDLGIFWPRAIDRAKKTHANRLAPFFGGGGNALSAMALPIQ